MGVDRDVTRGELLLDVVEGLEILPQPKDVFRPVVPGEGGDDLRFGGVTPIVPMPGEGVRVGAPGHDVAEDLQARDPGDVAHHEGQLDVHLDQRLLHALDMRPGRLDQRVAVSKIRAEGDNAIGRPEAPAQEADDMQIAEPFAIRHVALPARHVLDVVGVDETDGEPARIKDLVDGNPVDARGFPRDTGHAAGREPGGQAMEIAREGGRSGYPRRVSGRRTHGVVGRAGEDGNCDPDILADDGIDHGQAVGSDWRGVRKCHNSGTSRSSMTSTCTPE